MLIERVTDIMTKGCQISTNENIITEHLVVLKIRDRDKTKTYTCLRGKTTSCQTFAKPTHLETSRIISLRERIC